jgi:nucleoid DNA-binding protein
MSQIVHQVFSHGRSEQKQQRLEGQKKHKLDRQAKRERIRGTVLRDDIELENMFIQFGLSIIGTQGAEREAIFAQVPLKMQGRRVDLILSKALDFLIQEFDAEVIDDDNGRSILNFPKEKPKGDEMNLFSAVAERCGQKRSVVKEVYEALLKTVRITLKNERRIRLPEFAVVKVKYQKPRERAKKWNPFKKKKAWVEARPASNKIRVTPIKVFKEWATNKIEVIEPKKKHKKSKK